MGWLSPWNFLWRIITAWKVSKYVVFFWSMFSRIRTEYGEILRIFPYSVQMWKNTDQKKPRIWTLFTQGISLIGITLLHKQPQKYINADLKICQYIRLHVKIIWWRFRIKTPFTFWDMRTWDVWKICLQTAYFLKISLLFTKFTNFMGN